MDLGLGCTRSQEQNDILIAMDGSLSAKTAAILASQIAVQQHLRIKGLYVINEHYLFNNYSNSQPELGPLDSPPTRPELAELLRRKGELAMDWLERLCHSMSVPFRYEIVYGYVADEIVQQSLCARLVAFGKKGFHQPSNRAHLGENFHQFRNRLHAPYIAGDQELRPLRNILLGYTGSQAANSALKWAKTITEAFHANLYVAYVMEKGQPADRANELQQAIEKSGLIGFEWLLFHGAPADQIAKAVRKYEIDLLILGRHSHPAVFNWFTGSTLDQLLKTIRITTLVG